MVRSVYQKARRLHHSLSSTTIFVLGNVNAGVLCHPYHVIVQFYYLKCLCRSSPETWCELCLGSGSSGPNRKTTFHTLSVARLGWTGQVWRVVGADTERTRCLELLELHFSVAAGSERRSASSANMAPD